MQRKDIATAGLPGWRTVFKNCTDSYNLTHRETKESLMEKFGDMVKACQEEYNDALTKSLNYFSSNIISACEMDVLFGDEISTSDEISPPTCMQRSKNGVLMLNCPFLQCSVETVKLKRHLVNVHSMSEEKAKCGVSMATKMANSFLKKGLINNRKRKPQPLNAATSLVAKRHNYRICPKCKNAYKNLGQHLKDYHNMKPTSTYYELLESAVVVPSCYTKIENGRTICMKGQELHEAKLKFHDTVKKQKESLDSLKTKKMKLQELRQEIQASPNSSPVRKLIEIKKIREEYNNIRYNKPEVTPSLLVWKNSFLRYLEMIEYHDPSRGVAICLSILQPYEEKKVSLL